MKKILVLLTFVAAALGWFIVHQTQVSNANNGDLVKINSQKSQLVNPERRNITQQLTLAGSVDTDQQAIVKFQTSGKLAWVGVKVGDTVKKGQAIASLDKNELTKRFQKVANDYLAGYSTFLDTQADYQDEKDRYLVTDTIKRALERSQYTLNNTVLNYEIAELAVKYATITSPINGIVTAINEPHPGVNIIYTTAAFTIVDPQTIYFSAEVDQEDVIKLKTGQNGKILLDSFPDTKIDSAISSISFDPISGASTTSYEIRLPLNQNNQNSLYRLGMTGDLIIPLAQTANAISLPVSAVIEDNGQFFVLVKQSTKEAKKTKVAIGIESDDYVEIREGVSENDIIVIQ